MPRAERPTWHPLDCGCSVCAKVHYEAREDREQTVAMLKEQASIEDGVTFYRQEKARRYRLAATLIAAASDLTIYEADPPNNHAAADTPEKP